MSNSKPLEHDDSSGFAFVKEMLNGDSTAGINFDRLQWHPKYGYIIFEWLLCEESQPVTPFSSHPRNYWNKDKNKFISLWRVACDLKATLYLVNYAKLGTKAADEVLCIKVLDLDEKGIKDEKIQRFTRANFQSWLRKLNDECLNGIKCKTDETGFLCPNCGGAVNKSKYGYYCLSRCGMNISKVYGTDIGNENVERLLKGESCEIVTQRRIHTLILPYVISSSKEEKKYIQWRTKKANY